jgi:predicted nucleic acid-binding protein
MLVDTDILIDYLKDLPDAVEFVEAQIDQIFVSAITIAKLYQGVRDGEERSALDDFLSAVSPLDIDHAIGQTAGLYRREYKPSHNVGLADCLIAATAEAHNLPLKTLNTKHFPMLEDVEAPYRKE